MNANYIILQWAFYYQPSTGQYDWTALQQSSKTATMSSSPSSSSSSSSLSSLCNAPSVTVKDTDKRSSSNSRYRPDRYWLLGIFQVTWPIRSRHYACNRHITELLIKVLKSDSIKEGLFTNELHHEKTFFCHMWTTKMQISLRSLISTFVVRCLDSIISLVSIFAISRLNLFL